MMKIKNMVKLMACLLGCGVVVCGAYASEPSATLCPAPSSIVYNSTLGTYSAPGDWIATPPYQKVANPAWAFQDVSGATSNPVPGYSAAECDYWNKNDGGSSTVQLLNRKISYLTIKPIGHNWGYTAGGIASCRASRTGCPFSPAN